MNRTVWVVSLCLGLAATAALAQESPDKKTVYVRARDTAVTDKPKADGKRLKVVQPGEELIYLGQDKAAPRYHKVEHAPKKTGYVYFANISAKPVEVETPKGQSPTPLDRKASASFGAAVRGMTPGAEKYAAKGNKDDRAKAAKSFRYLEEQVALIPEGSVAQHRKSAGLAGGAK